MKQCHCTWEKSPIRGLFFLLLCSFISFSHRGHELDIVGPGNLCRAEGPCLNPGQRLPFSQKPPSSCTDNRLFFPYLTQKSLNCSFPGTLGILSPLLLYEAVVFLSCFFYCHGSVRELWPMAALMPPHNRYDTVQCDRSNSCPDVH